MFFYTLLVLFLIPVLAFSTTGSFEFFLINNYPLAVQIYILILSIAVQCVMYLEKNSLNLKEKIGLSVLSFTIPFSFVSIDSTITFAFFDSNIELVITYWINGILIAFNAIFLRKQRNVI